MKNWTRRVARRAKTAGFTLLEMLVVVLIIGIVAAIAAPGWTSFLANQRLNFAQERIYQAMQAAQSSAKLRHVSWQASFRTSPEGIVQWATHPIVTPATNAVWSNLESDIQMDGETTLYQSKGVRRVQFSDRGWTRGQLGRLTLSSKTSQRSKRCVIVSTLLGAVRKGQNQPKAEDGKFCR